MPPLDRFRRNLTQFTAKSFLTVPLHRSLLAILLL